MTTSVVYDAAYLANPGAYDIDPNLPLQTGQQYVDGLPGAFSDSAPDRWGRSLIDKRRRAIQRASDRRPPAATEVDYLLGVSDLTRQGNLRFADVDGDPFLDPDHTVPKLVALPRLLSSADEVADGEDDYEAVKDLLDAGSGSLGGARPKASIQREDGTLLIAKFPHRGDEWDVMAWEKTALDLAASAGIATPARQLTKVGERSVLILDRFDRVERDGIADIVRVGYISAMTLLGARDGDERDYADIAEAIPDHSARVNADLAELFRRVTYNIAIHNTDDHLRNHGFLRGPGGWVFSPAFDMNPDPDLGKRRATSVAGATGVDEEPEALPGLAEECRLAEEQALEAIDDVCAAVATWRHVAGRNGISNAQQNLFADAIDHQLDALRRLAR